MNKHRWKATSDHFYPGPKDWRCIKCGLGKTTDYECKPEYYWGGRTWWRFAPPCPPDAVEVEQTNKEPPTSRRSANEQYSLPDTPGQTWRFAGFDFYRSQRRKP